MSRRLAAAQGAVLALVACALLPASGQASVKPVTVSTIPPVPGAVFLVDGKTQRTDAKGRLQLRLPGIKTDMYRFHVHPQDRRLGPNTVARFARWYGHNTVTYELHFRLRFTFQDLARGPVDSKLVTSMTLKSRTGVRTTVAKGHDVWLRGSRVVPFSGKLVSKDIDYQVERAYVDGANVVNRAQQRFRPSNTVVLPVRLLFYSLKVQTKDALFGFPIGQAVELRYPSGRTVRHDLKDGQVTLPSLPRGTYDVKVVASGVSFIRPVSVSRNQQVELKVISYLDMILALGALVALALGLLVARRPHLLDPIKRRLRKRRPAGVGSE
jgi:hypothetical protein